MFSYRLLLAMALLPLCGCSRVAWGPNARGVLLQGNSATVFTEEGYKNYYFFNEGTPNSITVTGRYENKYSIVGESPWAHFESVREIPSENLPHFEYEGYPGSDGWTSYAPEVKGTNSTQPASDALARIRDNALPHGFYPFATKQSGSKTFVLAGEDPNPRVPNPAVAFGIHWLLLDSTGREIVMPARTKLRIVDWDINNHRVIFADQLRQWSEWPHVVPDAPAPSPSVNQSDRPPFLVFVWNYDSNTTKLYAFELKGEIHK
jgi:hypothetical protein